jgi:hypothetical protein
MATLKEMLAAAAKAPLETPERRGLAPAPVGASDMGWLLPVALVGLVLFLVLPRGRG